MKMDDKQLEQAFRQAMQMQIDAMPEESDCPEHTFSDAFEQDMHKLIGEMEEGNIKPAKAPMGWQYYTRRGLTVMLVCCLLTGIAMPDVVAAAYYKLIHAEERMFPEYTEYEVNSTASGESVLMPLELGYIPEDLSIDMDAYNKDDTEIYIKLNNNEKFFTLNQMIVTENDSMTYIVDTENAEIEMVAFGDCEEVKLIFKRERYGYVWLHGRYFITGQSNLSRDEIIRILENIEFKD